MPLDEKFITFVCDQMSGAGAVSWRKMFGGFTIYCDGKVIALVGEDRLFVRATAGGRAVLGSPVEAPPYPGAKRHFLVTDGLDDAVMMARLARATALESPEPKPKKPKTTKTKAGKVSL